MMKKVGLLLVGLAVIIMCGACNANKYCPAYADNSVEVELKV